MLRYETILQTYSPYTYLCTSTPRPSLETLYLIYMRAFSSTLSTCPPKTLIKQSPRPIILAQKPQLNQFPLTVAAFKPYFAMFFFFPDSQNQDLFIKMIGDTETFEKEEKIKKVEETKNKKEESALCSQSQNTEKQDEHDARIKRMTTGRLLFA